MKKEASFSQRKWLILGAVVVVAAVVSVVIFSVRKANQTTATDMRLTAAEGSVELYGSDGEPLSVQQGMKLHSGDTLSTKSKSYAYVTLDNTKVVKLDANSQVLILKEGSHLDLTLSEGKLFFNVKAPLTDEESLNIRTSTMVTGIRGTSGMVEVLDETSSAVSIYDGQVEVTVLDAEAPDGVRTFQVKAGQMGVSTPKGSDSWQLNLRELTAEDIPGFVAVELAKDPDLQRRIAEATDLPVDQIVASAQARLEQDEAQAEQNLSEPASEPQPNPASEPQTEPKNEALTEPDESSDFAEASVPTQQPEPSAPTESTQQPEPAPPAESTESTEPSESTEESEPELPIVLKRPGGTMEPIDDSIGQGDSTDSGESTEPTEPSDPTEPDGSTEPDDPTEPTQPEESYTITGTIAGLELQGYLDQYNSVTISGSGAVDIADDETVNIPQSKSVTVEGGGSFINNGTLINDGTFTSDGSLTNQGTITNTGTFQADTYIYNYGDIDNSGAINITSTLQNKSGATLTNSGTISLTDGTLDNEGTLSSSGSITISGAYARLSNSGTLTVEAGSSIDNSTAADGSNTTGINNFGTLNVSGTITNRGWLSCGNGDASSTSGTISIQSGGQIVNTGGGEIRNYDCSSGAENTIAIQAGGVLTNGVNASITNCGSIEVSGTFTNDGTYTNTVTVGNTTYTGSVANNGGTIDGANAVQIS